MKPQAPWNDQAHANAEAAVRGLFHRGGRNRSDRGQGGSVSVPVPAGPQPVRGGAQAVLPALSEEEINERV